jgi:HTH-type transcriptional regulator / antitoxin HigA
MEIKIIENETEYKEMLVEMDKFIGYVMEFGEENIPIQDSNKMKLIGFLIANYESEKYPLSRINPIDAIKFEMDQKGLRPVDMTKYFGSASRFYDIVNGKRNLSIAMIKKLHAGLKIPYDLLLA